MKKVSYVVLITILFCGCGLGHKSKQIINSAGQVIGEGSSELLSGISSGIDKTFGDSVVVSPNLVAKGVSMTKSYVSDTIFEGSYTLITYFIFNQNIADTVSAIIYDRSGVEYGRAHAFVKGNKGDADYFNFVFDKRTKIENKSKFVLK